MSQTERLYKLKSLLDAGQCLSKARLLAELAASPATLKRDLAHLRDRMNAPIVFDRERGGWRLDRNATVVGTQYELPGLWLSAEGIHARDGHPAACARGGGDWAGGVAGGSGGEIAGGG